MNVIYLLLRSSGSVVAIALFTSLVSGASSARLIALINGAISSQSGSAEWPIWSFVGLVVVMVISRYISGLLLIRLVQQVIFEMRLLLSSRILSSPLRYLEELGTPQLLAMLTDDVQSVANAVASIPSLCIAVAIVVGCLCYLAWLSWLVFLGFLGALVVALFSYKALATRARLGMQLAREELDQLFNYFRTLTEGIKELKLHRDRRKAFLTEDLQSTAANYRDYNVSALSAFTLADSWGQLILFVVVGFVVFVLPKIIAINPAVLSGYALTIIFIVMPMESLTNALPPLSRASVALKKIESINLSLASRSEQSPTIESVELSWQQLELSGVTHAYRGEREESSFTLGPIDLTFHPQELVFLVGGNGSGKSTLAKLITGLYVPESGKILLDGQPIDDQNREWYRQQFSVVFADFYLFDKLLGLGDSDLDRQVQDYLIKLQLDHKVQVKDGVLSTTALSQGQRKRLALLTAYLEDRPFYVFDEWASDQDPVFKEIFYTQLLTELKRRGKTVLVISHDDRYFHLADRVVKLDYGQLVQEGSRQ